MKGYELETRTTLPERSYTLVRVDVRAGHSYLRRADKPFDRSFSSDMQETARFLCEEISGAVLAYTQSDEISILMQDFASANAQPWFGGGVQKIVSTSAALATAKLNELRPGKLATFDSRVFTLPTSVEVANYFLWRQKDATRNSVSMAAQSLFSHKELQNKSRTDMREMMEIHGVFWEDFPEHLKYGAVVVKEQRLRPVSYLDRRTGEVVMDQVLRNVWNVKPAPPFSATEGFLLDTIPEKP